MKLPAEPRSQRIFMRRQRWQHLIFTSDDPRVILLNDKLEETYNNLQSKPKEFLSDVECIFCKKDLVYFKFFFCDSIGTTYILF